MVNYKYRNGTAELAGSLQKKIGEALEDGQRIATFDVNENHDGTVDSIEVNFS